MYNVEGLGYAMKAFAKEKVLGLIDDIVFLLPISG